MSIRLTQNRKALPRRRKLLSKRLRAISLAAAAIAALGGCSVPPPAPSNAELAADLERNYPDYTAIVAQCQAHPALAQVLSTDEESSWTKPDQYARLSSDEHSLYDSIQGQMDKVGIMGVTCDRDMQSSDHRLVSVTFQLYHNEVMIKDGYTKKGIVYEFEDENIKKNLVASGWMTPLPRQNWYAYSDR